MNTQEALAFLSQHQPMPDHPEEALMDCYKRVTEWLYHNPEPASVPLLIHSLAEWSDWLVYDGVQSILRCFEPHEVVPHLLKGCESPHHCVRLWSADSVRFFPDARFVQPLAAILEEPYVDLRLVAAASLESLNLPEVVAVAKDHLPRESDEEVREILEDIIAG